MKYQMLIIRHNIYGGVVTTNLYQPLKFDDAPAYANVQEALAYGWEPMSTCRAEGAFWETMFRREYK
jgi:hypothetical protein